MEYTFIEAVSKSLDLFLARPGQSKHKTDDLIEAWMAGLAGCKPDHIIRATYSFLQNKNIDYLPSPGVIRNKCKQLKVADLNTKNPGPVTESYSEENRDFSKKEAVKIQQQLKKGVKPFKKIPVEKIALMDYCNVNGDVIKIVAYGHQDIKDFEKNCFNQFLEKPSRIFHGYHKERRKTDSSGRKYMTMEQCSSEAGGTPITIGII